MTAPPLFIATGAKAVDAKGRVSVPPHFRTILGQSGFQGLCMRRHLRHPVLECGTEAWLTQLSPLMAGLDPMSEEYDVLEHALISSAEPLSWDQEGRITIPKKFLDYAGISSQAMFVGRRTHFEIWEPAAWERREDQARAAAPDVLSRLRARAS